MTEMEWRARADQAAWPMDGAQRALKILVCEDNRGDFSLLRAHLSSAGMAPTELDWVKTKDEAYTAIHRKAHDIALVDYNLIGGHGLDVLREAIAIDWPGPIIMVTGHPDYQIDITSMKLGAADFINKEELRPAMLERSIRYSLEKKRLELVAAETNRELLHHLAELSRAKAEIELQNRRIVSLARHLATSSHGQETPLPEQPGAPLGIWHFGADGVTSFGNEVVLEMLELSDPGHLIGKPFHAILSRDGCRRLEETLSTLQPGSAATLEVELLGQQTGRMRWAVMSLLPCPGTEKAPVYMATVVDITDRREIENTTLYLARHDSLTRLANRASFEENFRLSAAMSRRNGSLLGLICIDLDRFKQVNDSLGHQAGDGLLRQVARRLTGTIRESDLAARLGGDEFAVIATNLRRYDEIALIARKIGARLNAPYDIGARQLTSGASLGWAVFPDDGDDLETLFAHADAALYRMKRERQSA